MLIAEVKLHINIVHFASDGWLIVGMTLYLQLQSSSTLKNAIWRLHTMRARTHCEHGCACAWPLTLQNPQAPCACAQWLANEQALAHHAYTQFISHK